MIQFLKNRKFAIYVKNYLEKKNMNMNLVDDVTQTLRRTRNEDINNLSADGKSDDSVHAG